MNMETIATLGLMSQITPSSVSVNTVNGDHMGVAGDVRVHFKIGKKCSFTHSFVVCERLSHLFIIGEDFMRKHYMSLQWVPKNKRALGFQGETIAVASQAVLDETLWLRNAIRIPPRSAVMAPGYCNQMFDGKATAVPCAELKQRFPNLYMEPMQMNNSENKSYDTMIGYYLGLFSKLVCMRYCCTLHQTLYAWLMRGVWYWCGLECLIIGSYIYHSDVIAGMHAMLLI